MTGVKERVLEFLNYLQLSQGKFEEAVGLSNGFVNNIGDTIRESSIKKIKNRYPDLNEVWLKTGSEKMLISEIEKVDYETEDYVKIIDTQEM